MHELAPARPLITIRPILGDCTLSCGSYDTLSLGVSEIWAGKRERRNYDRLEHSIC